VYPAQFKFVSFGMLQNSPLYSQIDDAHPCNSRDISSDVSWGVGLCTLLLSVPTKSRNGYGFIGCLHLNM